MFLLAVTFPSSADVCCLKKKRRRYIMQLVWQQFACMKAAIVFLCRSVCVCVFRAGKSPSRGASALKRPSVEAAYTSSVRFLFTNTNASRRRRTYMYDCTNAHRCTETLQQKGWRGGVENQSWVQMKTYACIIKRINRQHRGMLRRVHTARVHTHMHTHTTQQWADEARGHDENSRRAQCIFWAMLSGRIRN